MKVLSIRQPWAWLIVNAIKDVENRTWRTHYRGPLLIHAGSKLDSDPASREFLDSLGVSLPDEFERGGIIGISNLIACVTSHASPWFTGPYGFVMNDSIPIPFIRATGKLGLFNPAEDILRKLEGGRSRIAHKKFNNRFNDK